MSGWLISVPVWGSWYVETFIRSAWPALDLALGELKVHARLLIHTDSAEIIRPYVSRWPVEFRKVQGTSYEGLTASHADAINTADIGERVGLLNADLILSRNLFARCEQHIQSGAKAVVMEGVRTFPTDEPIPTGAHPREVLSWALAHRHVIIDDLEWGRGESNLTSKLFFYGPGDSCVCRAFHLHPIAIHKEREIRFKQTIDGDLLDTFDRSSIHVVTDADDMAMLEISDPARRAPLQRGPMTVDRVVAWARRKASPMHRWLFEHPIVIQGSGLGCGDAEVADDILNRLGRRTCAG